jgi:integrase/recombinase XerD
MAQMTALRRRMIDDMTVRNLSPATQQSYVYAVAKFSRFFGCSPDRLGIEEVRAYQLHLAGLGWSWSHINQVSCALRFFFGVTLGRPEAFDRVISAKEPKKLPVVLSGEEIVRFLRAVSGLRNRAALTTAYGAGLRVCEVAALKVGDIDSSRMVIRVEHGKGGKDRYVMLSPQLLRILRAYWRLAKPAAWLFPGRQGDRSVGTATLQAACRVAAPPADRPYPPLRAALNRAQSDDCAARPPKQSHQTPSGRRSSSPPSTRSTQPKTDRHPLPSHPSCNERRLP